MAQYIKYRVRMGTPLKSGIPVVCGVIPIQHIIERFEIPYRSTQNASGYQRHPQRPRINRLANDIIKGRVDLPTSILINIRGVRKDCLETTENNTVLTIQDEKFYIVDGQHRVLALKKASESIDISGIQLNVVCMIGADEMQEMEQFYIVNSTAKAVRTDLAMDLLRQQATYSSLVLEGVLERGEKWKIDGQGIAQALNEESAVWRGRIRLPNEQKKQTIIPSSGFVTSLKKVLSNPFFDAMEENDQLRVIDAYWSGIQLACPEPFRIPNKYSIQKGIGVHIFHHLLPDVIERVRSMGLDLKDPASYSEIMEDVIDGIDGELPTGDKVSGGDFWRVVPDGAAGTYSSSAGKRLLLNKAKMLLPAIKI